MKLQTLVEIPKPNFVITPTHRVAIVGSCFADNIASKMELINSSDKWEELLVYNNPVGIVYNPLSVVRSLEILRSGEVFCAEDLVLRDGLYHSMAHHGKFSHSTSEKTLEAINRGQVESLDYIIITLGTIYTYFYNGTAVANCHKIPDKEFTRRPLTLSEISQALGKVASLYPTSKIIITLSPIRHLRDGLIANSLSKATLRVAIEEFCAHDTTSRFYFPSYELMMDELRDYRFTAEDMCHPTPQARDYIWHRFSTLLLSNDYREALLQKERTLRRTAHRPLH